MNKLIIELEESFKDSTLLIEFFFHIHPLGGVFIVGLFVFGLVIGLVI